MYYWPILCASPAVKNFLQFHHTNSLLTFSRNNNRVLFQWSSKTPVLLTFCKKNQLVDHFLIFPTLALSPHKT